jgi:hypothetical protein
MSKLGSPSSGKGLGGAKPVPTAKTAAKITGAKPSSTPAPKAGAKPGAKPVAAPTFKAGQLPSKTKAMTPGAPVLGQARMAQPAKAAQQVNADRMKKTFGKLGF